MDRSTLLALVGVAIVGSIFAPLLHTRSNPEKRHSPLSYVLIFSFLISLEVVFWTTVGQGDPLGAYLIGGLLAAPVMIGAWYLLGLSKW
jgi:hypothetical protein